MTRRCLVPAALALTACNTFTGASSLEIGEATDPDGLALADGIAITRVDLYQGVRRPLMEGGDPATSPVAIVRERDALLRVHYDLSDGAVFGLTARVTLGEGDDAERIEIQATAGVPSSDDNLATTINVPIPAEAMTAVDYRVELLQEAELTSGRNQAAAHPPRDRAPALLPLQSAGPLRLVVVPVRYDADGSGRLPDTSESQLALLRQGFFALFPVPEVEIRVTEPMPTTTPVSGDALNGWSLLLDEVQAYRAQSDAAVDEYYLGLFMAADTFGQFCLGGCITGLSNVAQNPSDAFSRSSIAIGFPGQASVDTAIHEVGHAHGRQHAPCGGAANPDPSYPYPDGSIGEWGYDLGSGVLFDPQTPDFMSYCDDPVWVSDYTFQALFTRSQLVNVNVAAKYGPPNVYDRILLLPDGTPLWRERISLRHPLGGEIATVVLGDDREVEGHFYPFDHADGGILLFPATDARRARFARHGRALTVTR
jgi:hypothetical protein